MPLIRFDVNTEYEALGIVIPKGVSLDGSFHLVKRLEFIPPPETTFKLKHVSFDSGGDLNPEVGKNKRETSWVSVDFPQLTDEIIHTQSYTESYTADDGRRHLINDFGVLRFPMDTFVVNGVARTTPGVNTNVALRASGNDLAEAWEQRSSRPLDINLGTFNLEDGFIECIVTPRDALGRTIMYPSNAGLNRIRQIQVILEYN